MQEKVVEMAREGFGKDLRDKDDMWTLHARCTVSNHASGLSHGNLDLM